MLSVKEDNFLSFSFSFFGIYILGETNTVSVEKVIVEKVEKIIVGYNTLRWAPSQR